MVFHNINYSDLFDSFMAEFFCKTGVKLTVEFNREEKIPSNLVEAGIYNDLLSYAKEKESKVTDWHDTKCYDRYDWLKKLRNQQLHFSAHCQRSYLVLAAHKPNFDNGQRKRKTIRG